MAKVNEVKIPKTFIVQKTFEVVVSAIDRDSAISEADVLDHDSYTLVAVKCGTPKQMKRDDIK